MSLVQLPRELREIVYSFLSPADLVSLSNSSPIFDADLELTQEHYSEALIEIECQEEYGGFATPPFDPTTGEFIVDLDQPEWASIKWACTACWRLLPHGMFDKSQLTSLEYRKPSPGTKAAEVRSIWSPSKQVSRQKFRSKIDKGVAVSIMWSLTQGLRLSDQPSSPVDRLRRFHLLRRFKFVAICDMNFEDYDALSPEKHREIVEAELSSVVENHCGCLRLRRKCLECSRNRGATETATIRIGSRA